MSETVPKKMVSRNVVIALGIICIILVASLAGAAAYYTSVVNGKDNKISSLESQLSNANNNWLNYEELKDFAVITTNETVTPYYRGTWGNFSGYSAYYLTFFSADYSGYLAVTVNDSTENPITITVYYSNLGYTFSYPLQIPINGTSYLPVIGCPTVGAVGGGTGGIVVLFKNADLSSDQATLTIVYYY